MRLRQPRSTHPISPVLHTALSRSFVRDAAAVNEPLLGEVELAERVGCTRKQVRDILASLEQQGVVHRRQGAATTVDPVAMRMGIRLEDQVKRSEEHTSELQSLKRKTYSVLCLKKKI